MNKPLPKPRMFSGQEQVNILIATAQYREEIFQLNEAIKQLRAANEELKIDLATQQIESQRKLSLEQSENMKLQERIENLLTVNEELGKENRRLLSENSKLLKNELKYRNALEYYANSEIYRSIPVIKKAQILSDNGELARYVLEVSST